MQTIYIQNISEKTKKTELKRALYLLFSTRCGPILEICVRKENKYRGQAWIQFDDMESAAKAVSTMNNALFFGKPLKVFFSKNKSHIIAKADGTYAPPTKNEPNKRPADSTESSDEQHPTKQARTDDSADDEKSPNKILILSNLPDKVTTLMVSKLFDQTPGYVSARMHDTIPNSAFVEFEDVASATAAVKEFQNMSLSGTTLSIDYANMYGIVSICVDFHGVNGLLCGRTLRGKSTSNDQDVLEKIAQRYCTSIELQRMKKFVFLDDFARSLVGNILVRSLLGVLFKIPPEIIILEKSSYGKPFWKRNTINKNIFGTINKKLYNNLISLQNIEELELLKLQELYIKLDQVYFNISHSGPWVVIVLSPWCCGIDVLGLPCNKKYSNESINNNFINEIVHKDEQNILNTACEGSNTISIEYNKMKEMLIRILWTIKEAYVKCLGIGLRIPFNSLNCIIDTTDSNKKNQFILSSNIIINYSNINILQPLWPLQELNTFNNIRIWTTQWILPYKYFVSFVFMYPDEPKSIILENYHIVSINLYSLLNVWKECIFD